MKLLFDQNISYRVIHRISSSYPEAKQVKDLGLENETDRRIWEYAREHSYSIVTFDADFYDMANIKGHPPKIIWLRVGNTRTENLAKLFINKFDLIKDFVSNPEYAEIACLEIK